MVKKSSFKIKFVDLRAQLNEIKPVITRSINEVLERTDYIEGFEVGEFERNFASYLGVRRVVGVNSGTDALILGVRALGLKPGDEIIVPTNSYISSALAASENDLKPVLVDVDEKDFGINLYDLKNKITDKTRAIIIVHLYGLPDKINEIKQIASSGKNKILLIEDACQAHGAKYRGKKVGGFGVFGAFSFYPGKNLGAYGDAGAIATNSDKLANKLLLLREYGQVKKYYHKTLGINSRMDTIQAAVLNTKLSFLDNWNEKRSLIAQYYTKVINRDLPFIITPKSFSGRESSWHIYCIKAPKRNSLVKFLLQNGIESIIHYPIPIHLQNAYKELNYKKGSMPHAEKLASEIMSLPLYPQMDFEMVNFVVEKIKEFYSIK